MNNPTVKFIFTLLLICIAVGLSYKTKSPLLHSIRNSFRVNRKACLLFNLKNEKLDIDFIAANKFLEKLEEKKASKILRKEEQRKNNEAKTSSSVSKTEIKIKNLNFAKKNALGQNIINCRDFNIDGQRTFEYIGGYNDIDKMPVFGLPEIAFIGRSNVGKSSLLNCLTGLNKKVAVESKTPGRTQLINMFKCTDSVGDLAIFVDLPGYGFAKMSKAQQEEIARFLRSYLEERGSLRLAVLLIDPRREAQDLDLGMLQFLQREKLPFVIVATKCDKLSKTEMEKNFRNLINDFGLSKDYLVPFSSVTGNGRRQVWNKIREGLVGTLEVDFGEDRINPLDERDYYSEDEEEDEDE